MSIKIVDKRDRSAINVEAENDVVGWLVCTRDNPWKYLPRGDSYLTTVDYEYSTEDLREIITKLEELNNAW